MSVFLCFAYIFFIGSIAGWCIEVVFRKFFSSSNPEHRWINPGFCTGPYLPIYGFGLCTLFAISIFAQMFSFPVWLIVVLIALCMTAIEYVAGLVCLKAFKLRLWDYSHNRWNIQGLICPLFSFFWALLGVVYYFLIHPHIIDAVYWLAENLAFSFVIGFFFGVFTLDVNHSANLVAKIKSAADDSRIVIHLEKTKSAIQKFNHEHDVKAHFIRWFKTEAELSEIVSGMHHDKLS